MRIDVDQPLWVVTDPGRLSEFVDICFRSTLAGLALQVKGGLDVEASHACIYIEELPARADALARLKARKAYDAALMEVRP